MRGVFVPHIYLFAMRTSLLFVFAICIGLTSTVDAQIRFLPYVGYATNLGYDFEPNPNQPKSGFVAGVGVEANLTPGILPIRLKARPSVETAFVSGGEVEPGTSTSTTGIRASLDLIGEFSPPLAPFGAYVGAGVTYMNFKATADGFEDFTGSGIGANLLAGVRMGGGFVSPFVQGRYTLGSPTPDDASISLGNSIAVQVGASIGL